MVYDLSCTNVNLACENDCLKSLNGLIYTPAGIIPSFIFGFGGLNAVDEEASVICSSRVKIPFKISLNIPSPPTDIILNKKSFN